MNLDTPLIDAIRIDKEHRAGLETLGLKTVRDLLHYFPLSYEQPAEIKTVAEAAPGERISVAGTISKIDYRKTFKSRIAIATARLTDHTGTIDIVWFHQPYIAKILTDGSLVLLSGTISENKKGLFMSNPDYEKIDSVPDGLSKDLFKDTHAEKTDEQRENLFPVYAETKDVSSRWLYHAVRKVFSFDLLGEIKDPLPEDMRAKYSLPSIASAIVWIHMPRRIEDAEAARKRFAFQEIFLIQLEKQKERLQYEHEKAWEIKDKEKYAEEFIKRLPFPLTGSQDRIIDGILADFQKNMPMSRLLEGDVGSGKTAVAATTAYAVASTYPKGQDFGNLQVAYMCPTEILAKQHFESFIGYFKANEMHGKMNIGLITSSECRKFPSKVNRNESTHISRPQLLKWVANGEIPILIGTHSLIQEKVVFKHLAYAIIDEQHRFGTKQRQKLVQKERDGERRIPHLLSMTATPIPRTLALTIYGDLDISVLDEMPAGRKPVKTEIVLPKRREAVYEEIKKELKNGRQLYVICPRIDESDPAKEKAVIAKSVSEEAKRLKEKVFQDFTIDILHSKMLPAAKEKTMKAFLEGKTDILVATSVVEVGVNVPNATMIIIEGAERFGLAQLHQLRGRVLRSTHQAYCYIFADPKSDKTSKRLDAFLKAKNGFELAEHDFAQRGAGTIYGGKQWGISDLGMEALKNVKMVEAARAEAQDMIKKDSSLSRYPLLAKLLESGARNIHFE